MEYKYFANKIKTKSPLPGCIIEEATDYYGQDLEGGSKIKVTANQQECADYSASTPGSLFWTWNKTTKKCYPKSSNAGRKGSGIHVSGNNVCGYSGKGIRQSYNGSPRHHRYTILASSEALVFILVF